MNMKSRKLIFSGIMWLSATGAMLMGTMTPEQWMNASTMILGVYVGGNSLEHLAQGWAAKK